MPLVVLPERAPLALDLFEFFELCEQKNRQQLAEDVAGADVNPCVFVHLAAEETTPVGALITDDLRALDERRIVEDECTTFAAADVFRFMKAQRCHRSE